MPAERIVYEFPAPNPFRTRIVAVGVTGARQFPQKPYRLVRDGVGRHPALLAELNHAQLRDLADALAAEPGRR